MKRPTQNDRGFFSGVLLALAIVDVKGETTLGVEIAAAADPSFLKDMAQRSGVEQDQRLVEKYCK